MKTIITSYAGEESEQRTINVKTRIGNYDAVKETVTSLIGDEGKILKIRYRCQ